MSRFQVATRVGGCTSKKKREWDQGYMDAQWWLLSYQLVPTIVQTSPEVPTPKNASMHQKGVMTDGVHPKMHHLPHQKHMCMHPKWEFKENVHPKLH